MAAEEMRPKRSTIRKNWFSIALFVVPLLSFLSPELGASVKGCLPSNIVGWSKNISVALIFLVIGMCVRRDVLIKATRKLRVNAYVQFFCFITFPALAFGMNELAFEHMHLDVSFTLGIIVLGALPTTISSNVIMTQSAKGNEAVALFNSVISSVLGIFFSPFILSFLMRNENISFTSDQVSTIIGKLCLMVILPMIIGQIFRAMNEFWVSTHYRKLKDTSRFLVLYLIYIAFCDTFLSSRALDNPFTQMGILCVAVTFLHFLSLLLCFIGMRFLNVSIRDQKAIMFTAPQKTLALGMPIIALIMATDTFSQLEHSELLYLPLLLYHHIQLMVAGAMIPFLKKIR